MIDTRYQMDCRSRVEEQGGWDGGGGGFRLSRVGGWNIILKIIK